MLGENYSMRECSCSPWLWVLYHMVVGCDDLTTVKNILRAFMYDIYQVFRSELGPQKEEWMVFSIHLLTVPLNREVLYVSNIVQSWICVCTQQVLHLSQDVTE